MVRLEEPERFFLLFLFFFPDLLLFLLLLLLLLFLSLLSPFPLTLTPLEEEEECFNVESVVTVGGGVLFLLTVLSLSPLPSVGCNETVEEEDEEEEKEVVVILEVMVGFDLDPLLLTDQPTVLPRGIFPVFVAFRSTSFDFEFFEDDEDRFLPLLLPEDEEEDDDCFCFCFCCCCCFVPWKEVDP